MRKCQLAILVFISFGFGAIGCSSSEYNDQASAITGFSQPPIENPTQPPDNPTQPPSDQPTETPTDMPTEAPKKKPCDDGLTGDPPRLSAECVACLAAHPQEEDESDEDYSARLAKECGGEEEGVFACLEAQAKVRGLGLVVAGVVLTCATAAAPACILAIGGAGATIIGGLKDYFAALKSLFDECAFGFCVDMCPQMLIWKGVCAALTAANNDLDGLKGKICDAVDAAKSCPGI
jgi:hypothetical protein